MDSTMWEGQHKNLALLQCVKIQPNFWMAKMFCFLHGKSGKVRDGFLCLSLSVYFYFYYYMYLYTFFFLYNCSFSLFYMFLIPFLFLFCFLHIQAWTRCTYILLHVSLSFGSNNIFHRFTIQDCIYQKHRKPNNWHTMNLGLRCFWEKQPRWVQYYVNFYKDQWNRTHWYIIDKRNASN